MKLLSRQLAMSPVTPETGLQRDLLQSNIPLIPGLSGASLYGMVQANILSQISTFLSSVGAAFQRFFSPSQSLYACVPQILLNSSRQGISFLSLLLSPACLYP